MIARNPQETPPPNHFNRLAKLIANPKFAVIWLGLVTLSFLSFDKDIAVFTQHLQNPIIIQIATVVSQFGISTYYFIFFVVIFLGGKFIPKTFRSPITFENKIKGEHKSAITQLALFFLLSLLFSGITCDLLKIILSRARPELLFSSNLYGFYFFHFRANMWSFPSGHSTTIASLAFAAILKWPRWWLAFILIMLLVGLSRIVLNAHYLSDVMAGWYLGAMIVVGLSKKLPHQPLVGTIPNVR